MPPPPSRISRDGTVMIRRSGKSAWMALAARGVPGIVERRHHDDALADVEVHVGRRHPISRPPRLRAGDASTPRASASVMGAGRAGGSCGSRAPGPARPRAREALVRVPRDRVLRVVRVVRPRERHDPGPHEAAQVVDVSRGLVLDRRPRRARDPIDAQVLPEVPLDVRAGLARIPVPVEQALLGRDERSFPVHLDGAALQDQARRVTGRPARSRAPSRRRGRPGPTGHRGPRSARPTR